MGGGGRSFLVADKMREKGNRVGGVEMGFYYFIFFAPLYDASHISSLVSSYG